MTSSPDGRPAVLLIGGSPRALRQAAATGARVVLLQPPGWSDPGAARQAHHIELVDYTDPDVLPGVARDLHARYGFTRAVSLTEPGLVPAALVNEQLGLGGTPAGVVRLLKDKLAMRARLAAADLSPVPAAALGDVTDLAAFAARHGTPAVVKPVDGVGSLAVVRLDRPGDVDSVWSRARRATGRPLMAEGYLDGPEISVEAFTFGPGDHRVLAITDKLVGANFVEVGHTVPARLAPGDAARVEALTVAFLDVVGLTEGPSHTEIKLTADGPRIVESHNRVGGDKIADLVRLTTGVDPVTLSFAWPLGLADRPPAGAVPRAGAAIRFLTPAPGRVRAVRDLDRVRAEPSVVAAEVTVAPGDVVPELARSDSRAGYVIARAADADRAAVLAQRHAATITIDTVPCEAS
ncbi:biotin carboxylase [Actinoplanes campanulatus]|uniref:Biotin carboxylase n=1 Tax=Actinoplanes campanulatus TaxID=113559 RepID=A0A7W5ADH3_9ACTN|nr:ATP-grasp domain-containing protein [Actinoplanes campanulatus]MBB3094307.1 biotin carboxylase [Actinoplanes campanulatus]GGN20112.1 hypothetical protein GCM10010109_33750 [Actinoplanes campanulatus]GID35774.1 hypothetical protein Aca09nite_22800 [Actinoplanes campanulatus]